MGLKKKYKKLKKRVDKLSERLSVLEFSTDPVNTPFIQRQDQSGAPFMEPPFQITCTDLSGENIHIVKSPDGPELVKKDKTEPPIIRNYTHLHTGKANKVQLKSPHPVSFEPEEKKEAEPNSAVNLDFDWACLPEDCNRYIAMDNDKRWFGYGYIPHTITRSYKWQVSQRNYYTIPIYKYPKNFTGDWRDSLFENPHLDKQIN